MQLLYRKITKNINKILNTENGTSFVTATQIMYLKYNFNVVREKSQVRSKLKKKKEST